MLSRIKTMLKTRRETRQQEVLRALKGQYHTFRVVLDDNERALELLSEVDAALMRRNELHALLEELLAVTFELVDGLNRFSDNHYNGLYGVQERLAKAARRTLAQIEADAEQQPLTLNLAEADAQQTRYIGGKAASLGELLRAGVRVPEGFAATMRACRIFLNHSKVMEKIQRLLVLLEMGGREPGETAEEIQALIMDAPLPDALRREFLARWKALHSPAMSVRSSALVEDRPEHSFAGQFTSVLNVCDEEGLLTAYKRVVAGNFGVRPLSYRLHGGLSVMDFDMGVLFQRMVDARAAGVLFTVNPTDPERGRMVITAVPGLGTQAVGGSGAADIFEPDRMRPEDVRVRVAEKPSREVLAPKGGLRRESVPRSERRAPVLDEAQVAALAHWGRFGEALFGAPQDMEWAIGEDGELFLLQSRPIRLQGKAVREAARLRGDVLLSNGVSASPGRGCGWARIVSSRQDLDLPLPDGPVVLVLSQSMVDAARFVPELEGVVVELGNPTDHLSCVAREYGVPMITGAQGATQGVREGDLVILDASEHLVVRAPEGLAADLPRKRRRRARELRLSPLAEELREILVPLNLTDAYGPTFSIMECRSLHDIVRFVHEKALINLFQTEDAVAEMAGGLVRWLTDVPLHFLVIDLGGGLHSEAGRKISLSDVKCAPLLALCEGMNSPGLRWRQAPENASLSGLVSNALLAGRGERPVGTQNYALIAQDYLNLNARVDFHFAMIDSVCGPAATENYIRFRFKGGGTALVQRERRAMFIEIILKRHGFFTDRRGDLLTASATELGTEQARENLLMLGRLLGFSRLMDAAMTEEDAPQRVAEAFLRGDWSSEIK